MLRRPGGGLGSAPPWGGPEAGPRGDGRHVGGAMADVSPVVIRPLTEADLVDADRVFRVAFGTFLGAPDPRQFFGDAEVVRPRWNADNDAAFAAVRDGQLVGSNFVANWGSVGFFGPLSVDPAGTRPGRPLPSMDSASACKE